ncbi:MAG: UDP-3-O-(3-hydroxymyristoyl)glucosamine N-acyltransferase [Pseudomonadota bacterium]
MTYSISEIAAALSAAFWGDGDLPIEGVAQPDQARAKDLALAMDPKFAAAIPLGSAKAAVLWDGADPAVFGLSAAIFAPRSRYALAGVTRMFIQSPALNAGIHPSAVIDPSAEIGNGASIGPFTAIGKNVTIGANARIYSHCSIADDTAIGADALIYSGVHIGPRVKIGRDFVCQSGAVIGADGFSYVTPQPNAVEQARASGVISAQDSDNAFVRIDSLGGISIGDRVEIGANASLDRGTLVDTEIGDGTKLDNQVHIGHNVKIGQDCLLCGQVGVAGSTVVGDRVVLGGQVGVADHLTVGSDVVVAGKSAVSSNVPAKRVMMGNPAMRMDLNVESYKALRRLPRILKRLTDT